MNKTILVVDDSDFVVQMLCFTLEQEGYNTLAGVDGEDALKHFDCPGQNFVFASKSGDIAIWQQGKFPARWDRQGLYVMPGADSSYMWQGFIPQVENPHILNPERGYLQTRLEDQESRKGAYGGRAS